MGPGVTGRSQCIWKGKWHIYVYGERDARVPHMIEGALHLSHIWQNICHICDRILVTYVTDYLSHMWQIICHICDRIFVTYVTNYLSHMWQNICHICDKFPVTYVTNYHRVNEGRSKGLAVWTAPIAQIILHTPPRRNSLSLSHLNLLSFL